MGRIRAALRVLFGRETTQWQAQREWAEIKAEAAQMFNTHNALAARLVRAEKQLAKRQREELMELQAPRAPEPRPADRKAYKAALRHAAAFGGPLPSPPPRSLVLNRPEADCLDCGGPSDATDLIEQLEREA